MDARTPNARVTPPLWLIIWVAVATEWLRGYMGGLFTGSKIILSPRRREYLANRRRYVWRYAHSNSEIQNLSNLPYGCILPDKPRPSSDGNFVTASDLMFPVLGALLSGWLTRRVGRKFSVLGGILLMAVGQLMAGVTSNFVVFYVGVDVYTAGSVLTWQVRSR